MSEYIERTDAFINSLGLDSYRVGGSVRDELLERRPKDADYMIRDRPLQELGALLRMAGGAWGVKKFSLSKLSLRDGRQAGWRVSGRGLGCIEIVLPRDEISTGPGHRDFEIRVDPTLPLVRDAQRRDFTFNALYKEVSTGEILDPTGCGLFDLERGYVRTTHEASFRDDPLRTLRALRFVSTLGYDLASITREQMEKYADSVDGLTLTGNASGTLYDEMKKLLMGDNVATALRLARDTGVLEVLIPELKPMLGFDQGSRYHDLTTDEHTFTALETAAHVDAPLQVRMALLFHDSGKPEAAWVGEDGRKHYYEPSDKAWYGTPEASGLGDNGINQVDKPEDHEVVGERIWRKAANRLNVDKHMREDVATLIRDHMVSTSRVNPVKVRRERVRLGDAMLSNLYLHRMCDLSGKGKRNLKMLSTVAGLEHVRRLEMESGTPMCVRDLEIDGKDVIDLGVTGKAVGLVLHAVLDEVVCDPEGIKLTREWQMGCAKRRADDSNANP